MRASSKSPEIPAPKIAAQGHNVIHLLRYAVFCFKEGNLREPLVKSALENMRRTCNGMVATCEKPFCPSDKDALTSKMLETDMVRNGALTFTHPRAGKRNLFVQCKR